MLVLTKLRATLDPKSPLVFVQPAANADIPDTVVVDLVAGLPYLATIDLYVSPPFPLLAKSPTLSLSTSDCVQATCFTAFLLEAVLLELFLDELFPEAHPAKANAAIRAISDNCSVFSYLIS